MLKFLAYTPRSYLKPMPTLWCEFQNPEARCGAYISQILTVCLLFGPLEEAALRVRLSVRPSVSVRPSLASDFLEAGKP